jgi:flagellar biosynthesis protein FlhB
MSDKAFEATRGRLERARREGDRPRAHDAPAVAALLCGSGALGLWLPAGIAAARRALQAAAAGTVAPEALAVVLGAGPVVAAAGLGGSLLAQFVVAGAPAVRWPVPKWERLNPLEGLKRMFSRDAAFAVLKLLAVGSSVGAAAAPAVRDALVAAGGAERGAASAFAGAERAIAAALGAGAAFAIGDALLERWKWRRRLRMSVDELKREHKASEGDPLLRGRRRGRHRALVRGSLRRLGEAAFVVVNPAHVAIALAYAPPAVAIPRVVVRAIDAGALEVKRRARRLGLPIVEDAALARTLLATTQAGDVIPREAYVAVAHVVAALVAQKKVTA